MNKMDEFLSRPFKALRLHGALALLASMFVLTGFTGLLAEQSFEKLLSSLLGASTPAAAVVLAVYFLGLTLGAVLYPRMALRIGHPLRLYSALELAISLWSLLLLLGSGLLVQALVPLLRLGVGHFWVLQLLRGLVACIWILPPTLAMGATFPAIVETLQLLRVPQPRRAMSRFYTLNLTGAIFGALAGPYFVFQYWGLTGALGLTFLVDALVAGLALGLAGRYSWKPRSPRPAEAQAEVPTPSGHWPLLWIAFASGFLFFGLEVIWTHLISAVLGNSIYAFAAMLALVLIGLGIGGGLSTLLFKDRRPASGAALALLMLAGGLTLAWQHRQWSEVPLHFIVWGSNLTTFGQGELLRWIQAGRLLLPSAVIFGMVYPSLFRLDLFSGEGRAALAARVGAANSIGCVLGALLTGFWLIPTFGSEGSLMAFGFMSVIAALILSLAYAQGRARWGLLACGAFLGIAWGQQPAWNRLALTSGGHVYFQPGHVTADSRLLFFQEDTLGGITTVVSKPSSALPNAPKVRTLLTNGKFQANDAGEVHAQTGFAMVPFLHTKTFEDALVIGLGSGHSAEVIHRLGFTRMDIAEIAPGIVEAARTLFPHINGRVLEQPNVNLILEDGRNHLLLTRRHYDLITMELTSVWFAGSTSLYSQEFYRLAKARLKPGGVFQQWIQIHHIGSEELGSVLHTLREVFPQVEFWVVGGQGILIASESPLILQPQAFTRVAQRNPWNDPAPEALQVRFASLLAGRLLAASDVDHLLAREPFPLNTDANRYLEYATPRYNLSRAPHEQMNIRQMGRFATFPGYPERATLPSDLSPIFDALTPNHLATQFGLDGDRPSKLPK
jgi:spermidine synthase